MNQTPRMFGWFWKPPYRFYPPSMKSRSSLCLDLSCRDKAVPPTKTKGFMQFSFEIGSIIICVCGANASLFIFLHFFVKRIYVVAVADYYFLGIFVEKQMFQRFINAGFIIFALKYEKYHLPNVPPLYSFSKLWPSLISFSVALCTFVIFSFVHIK